jgi:hypothetical protein
MGHLISGLFTRQAPAQADLRAALPDSIAFRVYRHPELGIYAVEGVRPAKPSIYPLSTTFPTVDLPLELGGHLQFLVDAYETARESGEANGIKRAYINLAETVSASLGTGVLAVCSDDDGVDFACIAEGGVATQVWAACGPKCLQVSEAAATWQPANETVLHQNAGAAFSRFTGADPVRFGFGSWDPPEAYGLVLVGT